jgi:hypothetical protein
MLSAAECRPLLKAWHERCRHQGRLSAPVFPPGTVTASIGDLNAEFTACQDNNSVFLDGSTTVNSVDYVSPTSVGNVTEEYPVESSYSVNSVWTGDNQEVSPGSYSVDSVWTNDNPGMSFVGAVFPEQSDVDSDEDIYLNDPDAVRIHEEWVLSFSTPPPRDHLLWPCHIHGAASSPSPVIHALIDHGCPTVLISCRVVNGLGLRRFALDTSLSLGGVGGGSFSCTDFVKLRLHSLDSKWTACTVRALIINQLPFDMILGLEWLKANKIIVDMGEHSVVAGPSAYVLIDSSSLCTRKPPLYGLGSDVSAPVSPHTSRSSTFYSSNSFKSRRQQFSVICELFTKTLLELKRKVLVVPAIEVKLSVAALHNRIAYLAAKLHHLRQHHLAEKQLKQEFSDISIESGLVYGKQTVSQLSTSTVAQKTVPMF